MSTYLNFKKELEHIDREFVELALAPFSKPFFEKAYNLDFSFLKQRVFVLSKNANGAKDEIEEAYLKNEDSFTKLVNSYYNLIESSFSKIVKHYSKGKLNQGVVSNPKKFWEEHMLVRVKLYTDEDKRPPIQLEDLGLLYAFELDSIRKAIVEKVNNLTGVVSEQNLFKRVKKFDIGSSIEGLRKKFRVKHIVSEKDLGLLLEGYVLGQEIYKDPEPKTTGEAYHYLTEYYAVMYFEVYKNLFIEKYKAWQPSLIQAAITDLEMFIQKANNCSISEAYDTFSKWNDKDEYVFLRLKHGFYEHLEINRYPTINAYGNLEASIYGKYFLFYDYLKGHLEKRNQSLPEGVNIFCRSMPIDVPKEHFKILVERNSKNGRPFLTPEQFDLFIAKAFYGKCELGKLKFNQAPKGEKLQLQKVFYEFYNKYCFEYFNTMQCADKFIKLLTDNFEGWDFQNVKNNFTPKTKRML